MAKYIDEIRMKHPGLTEADYDIINREALLEIDKAINDSQKTLSAVRKELGKLKTSSPFNIFRITLLIKFEIVLTEKLKSINSVKAELFGI